MKHIVVSWIAWVNDFRDGEVDPEGPTASLHLNGWDSLQVDLHLMLDPSAGTNIRSDLMYSYLNQAFGDHDTIMLPVGLDNPLDFREIKQKITAALQPYKQEQLTLIISNGTTPMRTTWILFHLEDNGFNTRLLQGVGKDIIGHDGPYFQLLELDHSIFVGQLLAKYEDQKAVKTPDFVTDSLAAVYEDAVLVAEADPVPVLIGGPSGSGKESLAMFVKEHSPRRDEVWLTVNCAAIDNQLLESRLFGYIKGSYTGADKNKQGFFQAADGGTIFLDEIGDITPALQQSLLRVLQSGEVLRVGSNTPEKVDVRVIAATNRNLWALCEQGDFRWDLYYRLSVAELHLPAWTAFPTAEKKEILANMIERKKAIGKRGRLTLTMEARRRILAHHFPGNFRELENLITSLYIFSKGDRVTIELLERYFSRHPQRWEIALSEVEKRHVTRVFDAYEGNFTQAAKALGIAVNTLKKKLGQ